MYLLKFLLFLIVSISCSFAQSVPGEILPYDEFFSYLLKNIGGIKGASSLGVGFIISQLLVKLLETKVGLLIGKYKMLIVSLLTLIVGATGLALTTNISIVTALFSSANVVLLQGFGHQVYKQFFIKVD